LETKHATEGSADIRGINQKGGRGKPTGDFDAGGKSGVQWGRAKQRKKKDHKKKKESCSSAIPTRTRDIKG